MLKNHAVIALVGNPNSGKTTLFNTLTGARQQVGNWAGVTVESISGSFCVEGETLQLIDLPGTYSLTNIVLEGPQDEQATVEYLRTEPYSCVLNVVDALHLERNLYVTLQCLEQRIPMVVALNKKASFQKQQQKICIQTLSEALGCPVYSIAPREGLGIEPLKQALLVPTKISTDWKIPYPQVIEETLQTIESTYQAETGKILTRYQGLCYLEGEKIINAPHTYQCVMNAKQNIEKILGMPSDVVIATARYQWIESVLLTLKMKSENTVTSTESKVTQTLDKIVCHRYLGFPIFLTAMYSLFFFAIKVGGFFQDYVESAAHFIFVDKLSEILSYIHSPEWLIAMLAMGMGEGITTVLTFVPVIGAMFFF